MAEQLNIPVVVSVAERRWTRYVRAAELWVPAALLTVIVFACFIWPLVGNVPNPVSGQLSEPDLKMFSPHHIFGTDPLGNDNFSRLLYGGRVSLEVGFGSVAIGMIVGSSLGIAAGYAGGVIDGILARVLDMLLAFPSLVLAIIVATYLGPSELHVILAISLFSLPAFARLARTSTRRLLSQPFMTAAKLTGVSIGRTVGRHIVPNIVPELMTFALLSVSTAIIIEASLSFLGLGIPPPAPTWGGMIYTGEQNIYTAAYLLLLPCAALFLTVLSLNLLGDALRVRWSSR